MLENWKDVKGYEGLYQVSDLGNVRSLNYHGLKGNIKNLKLGTDSTGYLRVCLHKDKGQTNKRPHQLVAESFLNHKPNGVTLVVNHIDFDIKNNKLSNLEIVTQRENGNQKHLKSTSVFVGVFYHKLAKKWQSSIVINGKSKYLGLFKSEVKASTAYLKTLSQL